MNKEHVRGGEEHGRKKRGRKGVENVHIEPLDCQIEIRQTRMSQKTQARCETQHLSSLIRCKGIKA